MIVIPTETKLILIGEVQIENHNDLISLLPNDIKYQNKQDSEHWKNGRESLNNEK